MRYFSLDNSLLFTYIVESDVRIEIRVLAVMSVSRPLLCTGCILSCCKTVLTDLAEPRARDYNVGKVEERIFCSTIFLLCRFFSYGLTYSKIG